MSKTKITTPVAGYSGTGPGGTVFEDGVGYTDDEAAINYFRAAGYGVGSDRSEQDEPERIDSRDVPDVQVVGTRLRDASVDPKPGDFLVPTNAGDEDPHGPLVVAPGVHAIETQPIRPGVVHVDDPAKQEKAETEQARRILVDGEPVGDVIAPDGDADRGPLDMSDPGSAEVGVEQAKANAEAEKKGLSVGEITVDLKVADPSSGQQAAPAKKTTAKKAATKKRTSKPKKS